MTQPSDTPVKAPRQRLRMGDLAALAGVSTITVSRALSNSELVRPDLRETIQALAREHGYRLNTAARNLRLRRNHSITTVINLEPSSDRTMSDPIFLGLLGGLLQATTDAGYRTILTTPAQLLSSSHDDTDGIVFLGQGADDRVLREVGAFGIPLIVWGALRSDHDRWLTVGSDNGKGGRLIAEHLGSLGRTDVLFLGEAAYPEVQDRLAGLQEALRPDTRLTIRGCEFGETAGSQAMARAIAEGWRGDAVACASDTIALGAMQAVAAAGWSIPERVAVVGYDGIAPAETSRVPLTTVEQSWEAGGKLLATKLLAQVAGNPASSEQLDVTLIARQSTLGL